MAPRDTANNPLLEDQTHMTLKLFLLQGLSTLQAPTKT